MIETFAIELAGRAVKWSFSSPVVRDRRLLPPPRFERLFDW